MGDWGQLLTSVPRPDLRDRRLSLCVQEVKLELVEGHLLVCLSERTSAFVPHSPSSQCLFDRRGELQSAPVSQVDRQQCWDPEWMLIKVQNAWVTSSNMFFPRPANDDTVSHPLNACKKGKAICTSLDQEHEPSRELGGT